MKTPILVALLVGVTALPALAPSASAIIQSCTDRLPVEPPLPVHQCVTASASGVCVDLDGWIDTAWTCVFPLPPAGVCEDGWQIVGNACTIDVPRAPEGVCLESRPLVDGSCGVDVDVPGLVRCRGDEYALHVAHTQTQCYRVPLP